MQTLQMLLEQMRIHSNVHFTTIYAIFITRVLLFASTFINPINKKPNLTCIQQHSSSLSNQSDDVTFSMQEESPRYGLFDILIQPSSELLVLRQGQINNLRVGGQQPAMQCALCTSGVLSDFDSGKAFHIRLNNILFISNQNAIVHNSQTILRTLADLQYSNIHEFVCG